MFDFRKYFGAATSQFSGWQQLFRPEWTQEPVARPERDFDFWVLRILGMSYLAYLPIVVLGGLGFSSWPAFAQEAQKIIYDNPAMAMNTFGRIGIVTLLAFIGAYNRQVRWHVALVLLVTHALSLAATTGLLSVDHYAPHRAFMIAVVLISGVMVTFLAVIMLRHRQHRRFFSRTRDYPTFYSIPARMLRWLLYSLAAMSAAVILLVVILRFTTDGMHGWAAVYGYPDPQLANTITKYGTLSLLALLMAEREKLRDYFFGVLVFGFAITLLLSAPWVIIGDMFADVHVKTRAGDLVTLDWYFMLHVVMDGSVVAMLIGLRKMYYNVDYVITSLSPSSARCVIALHRAFFPESRVSDATILQRLDRHVAGVRGRKRGLLSFPFWLVEHAFGLLYGLRPPFSLMSPDEQRFFLRKYVLRPPDEIASAWVPSLAETTFKLGTAVHALITMGHYSSRNGGAEAGYVPPDARDRLQNGLPAYAPPSRPTALLPDRPEPPASFPKRERAVVPPLPSSRLLTPTMEPEIPRAVDYLIIGSGAGGAVMAYRLACTVIDPSRILVVERGERYTPLQDFNDDEMAMICKLYKEGGLQQTKRFDLMVLQGECVGGTTVINNGICVQMPATVRHLWENRYDVDLTGLDREYGRIAQELEIGDIDELAINQRVKARFLSGVKNYNQRAVAADRLTIQRLQANFRNHDGSGLDNLGNKRLRKRTMLETYLPWAEARGAKIVSGMSAIGYAADGRDRRAESVWLRTSTGEQTRVIVRRAVIVAAGAIASSHFLIRSGGHPNAGKLMSCNFALPVAFEFPDRMDAFDGVQISVAAAAPDYRAMFETYFNPPGTFAISLPFYFGRHQELMRRYPFLANFGALVGSEARGNLERKTNFIDGRSFTWTLGTRDQKRIKYALATLIRMGQAAGAIKAVLPTNPGIALKLNEEAVSRFERAVEQHHLTMSDLRLATAHPQGGNNMLGEKSQEAASRVVDENFRVDGMENVFVADASIFPSSLTANPQWTILALSSLAAGKVLERAE